MAEDGEESVSWMLEMRDRGKKDILREIEVVGCLFLNRFVVRDLGTLDASLYVCI